MGAIDRIKDIDVSASSLRFAGAAAMATTVPCAVGMLVNTLTSFADWPGGSLAVADAVWIATRGIAHYCWVPLAVFILAALSCRLENKILDSLTLGACIAFSAIFIVHPDMLSLGSFLVASICLAIAFVKEYA